MKNIYLSFFFILCLSSSAFGWGDLGHKTIAYIAEKNLSDKAQQMVSDILGEESLVVASVFADQVRQDERFDVFKPYHYVDLKEGSKISTGKNAHGLIQKAIKEIGGKDASLAQKRFLLRYLVHVVGDVHQPLHVGNGMDVGGNTCTVNWRNPYSNKTEKISLHLFWDEKLFDYYRKDFKKGYFDYKDLSEIVEAQNAGISFGEKTKVQEELWYGEGQALHSTVYPIGKSHKERSYCDKNKAANSTVPLLNDAYKDKALRVVNSQLQLAGLRLAVVLNGMSESYKKTDTAVSAQTLLKSVEMILEQ